MTNKSAIHRAARDRAVGELLAVREEFGALTTDMYKMAGLDSGYHMRTMQRQVAAHDARTRQAEDGTTNEFVVDEDVIELMMRTCGNFSSTWSRLKREGRNVPSLSTFRRKALNAMGATMLATARKGASGARASKVYLGRTKECRGYTYQLDHTELPILVVPDGFKRAVKPWMTVVMEAETRYVLSWVITFGTPTAEEIRAALIAAFTLRRGPDGDTVVGGAPERCLWDRGLDFLSDLVTESCLRLHVTPVALPGYSPHLKGRLERFWRFFKENCLAPLPGYTDTGHDLRGNLLLAKTALTESAFLLEVDKWMTFYHLEHVNRNLGKTPLQAWNEDPTPLREIPYDQLWQDFLLSKNHTVGKSGIRFDRIDYVALDGELDRVFGTTVEVRHLPHDRSFIEVFHNGRHLATCYPADNLRPDDQDAFLAARRRDDAKARKHFSASNRLRGKHEGAKPIEKVAKRGQKTEYLVTEAAEIDLFSGGEQALARFKQLPDDPQGRLL